MRGSAAKLAFGRKRTGQAARVKTRFLKAERQTTHRRRSRITSHLTAGGESRSKLGDPRPLWEEAGNGVAHTRSGDSRLLSLWC